MAKVNFEQGGKCTFCPGKEFVRNDKFDFKVTDSLYSSICTKD